VANQYALILFLFSFVILLVVYLVNRHGLRVNKF